jgi:hypothetical protein
MTQQRIDSIFQGDYGVRCAAIIGNDDDRLRWSTSSAIWCRKPATHATVGNPDLGVNPLNVIHYYCAEHAYQHHAGDPAVMVIPQRAQQEQPA